MMKVVVFVDYWNLQLGIQQLEAKALGVSTQTHRFSIDWFNLGVNLTAMASSTLGHLIPNLTYQETRIFTSDDPNDDGKYKRWVTNTLAKQPSVRAFCLERKVKRNQDCPACHHTIDQCPKCQATFKSTQEKGVDTLLATQLLTLGLDGTYDVAIIVSQDSDMKPAVQHLSDRGVKIIHAAIKHFGSDLSSACWAKFEIFDDRHKIERR